MPGSGEKCRKKVEIFRPWSGPDRTDPEEPEGAEARAAPPALNHLSAEVLKPGAASERSAPAAVAPDPDPDPDGPTGTLGGPTSTSGTDEGLRPPLTFRADRSSLPSPLLLLLFLSSISSTNFPLSPSCIPNAVIPLPAGPCTCATPDDGLRLGAGARVHAVAFPGVCVCVCGLTRFDPRRATWRRVLGNHDNQGQVKATAGPAVRLGRPGGSWGVAKVPAGVAGAGPRGGLAGEAGSGRHRHMTPMLTLTLTLASEMRR